MMTTTSENIKKLTDKIADLEDELRASERTRDNLLRLNDELQLRNRKLKATIGILKRAIRILNDPEEED